MSLTHSTAAKNAAADAVVGLIDTGGEGANGTLELQKADGTVIASCDLSDPAFGSAAAGVATADTISEGTAVAAGDIAKWRIKDKGGTVVISGMAGKKYTVTGISQASKTITVAEDLSGVLTRGSKLRVTGSTGNDGTYTVISAVYGTSTVITVVESLPNATVDGAVNPYDLTLDNPTGVVIDQTVRVSALTYQAEVT